MSQQHDVRRGRQVGSTPRGRTVRPQVMFAIAIAICLSVCGLSQALLPADAVIPLAVSACLACAAALGLIAWRRRDEDLNDVTCADAAGALVLIGAFAAATAIGPEQLMRLVGS